MYFKLSVRNARRSFINYLLYIATLMTLMSVMEISQCIAISMDISGFQTASLPILIGIIQVILVSTIDRFMLKQRAKEFASYLLLGMEKGRLTALFLLEFSVIGLLCFAAGTTLGYAAYCLFYSTVFSSMAAPSIPLYGHSTLHCLFYFCLVEIVCAFPLKRRLDKLQIRDLMYEKNHSQMTGSHSLKTNHPSTADKHYKNPWGIAFRISYTLFVSFLLGITFLPGKYASALIAVIVLPLSGSVFTFYKWLFQYFYVLRKKQPDGLYQGSRLYLIAKLTTNFQNNAVLNCVFCICLLFSFMAFLTGTMMLQEEIFLFDRNTQLWMGTSQVCLCILFLVIYFFILSLQQLMELKHSTNDIPILHCIGEEQQRLHKLVNSQICIGLTLPMLAAILILLFSVPLLNWRLNLILPETMRDIILKSSGWFLLCISLSYFCFYEISGTLYNNFSHYLFQCPGKYGKV